MNPVRSFSEPFVFSPLYQVRVWGGRDLERVFGRQLPDPDQPYGEAWELSDRPEAMSRLVSGPADWVGRTLGDLWREPDVALREAVFGPGAPGAGPFPLLFKILDARERLSLQVHPPASEASALGGEPKTEIWYIAAAADGAELYAGVTAGTTRERFEEALTDGSAERWVHRIPVKAGDFLFVPSGRLHAIGAGLLIFEIQQNSDTTYRVYDWNRLGLDGRPRELHVAESMRCIDFTDVEPGCGQPDGSRLAACDYFQVERHTGERLPLPADRPVVVTVVSGTARLGAGERVFRAGDSFLVPASWLGPKTIVASGGPVTVLTTTW